LSKLVADFVLERLREWGVHRIYGYPGDGITKKAAKALAKGDPETLGIVEKGAKQKAHEFTESIKAHLPGGDR
jgi:thiamine pyrophosphate-dependent acetolactate synthase large subunit-like protein